MKTLIPKGEIVPVKKRSVFTTFKNNNQRVVSIKIFLGQRPFVKDNYLLSEVRLFEIPSNLRGTPQIEISLEIDNDETLIINAIELESGVSQNTKIINYRSKISRDDIESIIFFDSENLFTYFFLLLGFLMDADNHADTDKIVRERIKFCDIRRSSSKSKEF